MANLGQRTLSAVALSTLVGLAVLPAVASAVGACLTAEACAFGGPDHACCPDSDLEGGSPSGLSCCRPPLPSAETPMASPPRGDASGVGTPTASAVAAHSRIESRHAARSRDSAPFAPLFSIHCVYRI